MSSHSTFAKVLRPLFSILLFLLLTLFMPGHPRQVYCAEEFPSKEIKLVVPFGVGGGVDLSARIFADKVGKVLGVPMVVTNNAAGAGVVATVGVAKAKPDGYTLLYAVNGILITKPILTPEVPYRLADFTAICQTLEMPVGLWVQSSAPWKNLKEFVDYAKNNPGKLRASVAIAGAGLHVATDLFKTDAGINAVDIPTSGGSAQTTALMGGHAEFCIDMISTGIGYMRAGRLRALAFTRKVSEFPAIKTFDEEGYPMRIQQWHGVFAPKGLPEPLLSKLAKAFEKVCNDPSTEEELLKQYIFLRYREPVEMAKFLETDWEITLKTLKQSGLAK